MSAPFDEGAARERLLSSVGGLEKFGHSFNNRSFSPERRAAQAIDDCLIYLRQGAGAILAAGGTAEMVTEWSALLVRKWLAYQAAGARTSNWMITGPARFPVEQNRKRMETEHKRMEEFLYQADGAAAWTRARLRSVEKRQMSDAAKASGVEHKEKAFDGGKVVLNKAIDRVQLVFDDRPSPEIITELKGRAFRWSPREGAWQRQLTQNGVWAAESVVKAIAKTQP